MNKKSAWTQSALQEVCNFGEIQKGEQYARTRAGTRRTRDAREVSKSTPRVSHERVHFSRHSQSRGKQMSFCGSNHQHLVVHAGDKISELTFSRCISARDRSKFQCRACKGNGTSLNRSIYPTNEAQQLSCFSSALPQTLHVSP